MNPLHPDDRAVALKENLLGGKTIALALGGGIAATESVKLIRSLRRYGARVRVYAGHGALKFITPTSLEWASGEPIITESDARQGGSAEHLFREDLLLIAPATFNVISKSALGIADTLVTTLIASALGRMAIESSNTSASEKKLLPSSRIVMVPSMHQSLQAHPLFASHQRTLSKLGVQWVAPEVAEGKWKSPSPESIALTVMRSLAHSGQSRIFGKKVFITAGSVPSYLDNIRMLTNIASGQTGLALAVYAHALGAEVTLLIEHGKARNTMAGELFSLSDFPFRVVHFHDYPTYYEQTFALLNETQPDLGIFTAAVSDYKVKNFTNGKIPSDALKHIELDRTEKIAPKVRKDYPSLKVVAFKLESNLSVEALLKKGESVLLAEDYAMLVTNRLEDLTAFSYNKQGASQKGTTAKKTTSKTASSEYTRYLITRDSADSSKLKHTPLKTQFELAKKIFGYSP